MSELAHSLRAAPAAIAPSLARTFGGVWRLTYPNFFRGRHVLLLAALSAVLYLLTVQNVGPHRIEALVAWTAEFYLRFLLPSVALLSAAGMMRDDMASVSVDYVLTRPVRRPIFVALRYASHMVCMQVSGLLPLAALVMAGAIRDVPVSAILVPLIAAQVLTIAGFSALGVFFGAVTARYFPLAISYGLIVEIGVGNIPTQVSKLAMTHHVIDLFAASTSGGGFDAGSFAATTGAILIFIVIALAGAIAVFSLREFTGAGTAEK